MRQWLKNAVTRIILIVFYSTFTMLFHFFVIPFHEFGHVLACQILGIQIVEIQWWGLQGGYVQTRYPLEAQSFLLVCVAGGFFASLVLLLVYVIISRGFRLHVDRKPKFNEAMLIIRIVVMASLMIQVLKGILEGFYPEIYMRTFEPLIYFTVTLAFVILSLNIHIRMARKAGVFVTKPNSLE